jgi:hypothetical protein
MRSFYSGFAAALLLTACGGGGNQVSGIDGSGSPQTSSPLGYSSGTINGFGSVIVNGVRYQSDKAKILVNDEQSNEAGLRAGYQVNLISHTADDGSPVADSIEFHPNLVGGITAIDLDLKQFTLLGQRVQVTSETLFDAAIKPNYLDGLQVGNRVLVSGKVDAAGVVTATRIELITTGNHQAMGVVSGLNEATTRFALNGLNINYAAASLNNFPNNRLANGLQIVAIGSLDNQGVLQAKTITNLSKAFDKNIKTAELEGFITRFNTTADFDVAGTKVTTNAQTRYENGSADQLVAGVAVELKGSVNSAGIVVAERIEFAKAIDSEIAGDVSQITPGNTQLIATGSLQINGTNIQTTVRTAYEDKGKSQIKRFNFSAIQLGDFLKVSGYNRDGIFIATKIERAEIEDDESLQFRGLVLSVSEHSFVILGKTINTNNQTRFKAPHGDDLTEPAFYAQALGKRVIVKGQMSSGKFTATEVEIQEKD